MSRNSAVGALLVLLALALAANTCACSCRPVDLQRDLPTADGAFIGTVLERSVSGQTATYRFRVEQVYRGNVSSRPTFHDKCIKSYISTTTVKLGPSNSHDLLVVHPHGSNPSNLATKPGLLCLLSLECR